MYGLVPDPEDHRDVAYNPDAKAGGEPRSRPVDLTKDWSGKQWPVFEQGSLNSCTANAIAGAVMYMRLREQKEPAFVPSRLYLWWKGRKVGGVEDENASCNMREALKALAANGICPEAPIRILWSKLLGSRAAWPYEITRYKERPRAGCFAYGKLHRDFRYLRVRQNLSDMRRCLNRGHPFLIGVGIYPNTYEARTNGGHFPMPPEGARRNGGHALLVVGYDHANRRFKVRNSFGDDWGDRGYGTIPYAMAEDRRHAWGLWTLRRKK